jgi:hypothetical protein
MSYVSYRFEVGNLLPKFGELIFGFCVISNNGVLDSVWIVFRSEFVNFYTDYSGFSSIVAL